MTGFDGYLDLTKATAMRPPLVSWLLCTHVAGEQLRLSILSCLDQDFTDFELVLVVNGPSAQSISDYIKNWVGRDTRVRIFTTEVRHLIFSLSLGLHHARGALVARMDGDDLSARHRLGHQVAFMQAHPEVVALGSAYEVIDVEGLSLKKVTLPLHDVEIRRSLFSRNPLCHPSVIFRRDAILAVGGYLGGIYAEDYDLWMRLSNDKNNKFANLSIVCLAYRKVGVGLARKSRTAYASMAGSQYRNFVDGHGSIWIFASILSTLKALFLGSSGS